MPGLSTGKASHQPEGSASPLFIKEFMDHPVQFSWTSEDLRRRCRPKERKPQRPCTPRFADLLGREASDHAGRHGRASRTRQRRRCPTPAATACGMAGTSPDFIREQMAQVKQPNRQAVRRRPAGRHAGGPHRLGRHDHRGRGLVLRGRPGHPPADHRAAEGGRAEGHGGLRGGQARREGPAGRLRRGDLPGRRGRRPHRPGGHPAAGGPGRGRGQHPGGGGGRPVSTDAAWPRP